MAIISTKFVEAEATLESERATLVAEKVEVFKASKALKAALATISQKEGKLNAAWEALAAAQAKALANNVAARVASNAKVVTAHIEAEEEVAVARVEAEKAPKDEFGADFFQGYTESKIRVALLHLEWDLSAFSGANSNY